MADQLDKDMDAWKKAKESKTPTIISYMTKLKDMYKDKPVTPAASAAEPAPKKRKVMGQDSLDEETRKEL